MAREGKLVRLENGRWAQFQLVPVADGVGQAILAAVELEDARQALLNAAESSYLNNGSMNVELEAGPDGQPMVRVEAQAQAQL